MCYWEGGRNEAEAAAKGRDGGECAAGQKEVLAESQNQKQGQKGRKEVHAATRRVPAQQVLQASVYKDATARYQPKPAALVPGGSRAARPLPPASGTLLLLLLLLHTRLLRLAGRRWCMEVLLPGPAPPRQLLLHVGCYSDVEGQRVHSKVGLQAEGEAGAQVQAVQQGAVGHRRQQGVLQAQGAAAGRAIRW